MSDQTNLPSSVNFENTSDGENDSGIQVDNKEENSKPHDAKKNYGRSLSFGEVFSSKSKLVNTDDDNRTR
jgi:hypothetical protein